MASILFPILILSVLGIVFGLLLGYASQKFAIEENPLVPRLREKLPGANCGGCSYPGCDAYAKAVAEGKARIGLCAVGGTDTARAMSEIMGVQAEEVEPMAAHVFCAGAADQAGKRYAYEGVSSCLEAKTLPGGGPKVCRYGCLGYGDCVKACQFDAIHVSGGVAVVDIDRCKACGACVKVCPKHIIQLVPKKEHYVCDCINEEFGKSAQEACRRGCIGCSICARNCPAGAITMVSNHPVVDASLCTSCGTCEQKCPYHLFHPLIKGQE